ncbi:hypothetical protein AERO9AM_11006 [Aeromicrobium sp. 9AM]|nr:hypothetical protein AERO9AM_11006 [Aeromicrobium sp. 9AM]
MTRWSRVRLPGAAQLSTSAERLAVPPAAGVAAMEVGRDRGHGLQPDRRGNDADDRHRRRIRQRAGPDRRQRADLRHRE